MTAPSAVLPSSPATQRGRPLSRWWWALAAIGLAPTLIPTLTLVGSVLSGDAVASVPAGRLAELLANTLLLAVSVTATSVAIGLATSWVTTRTDLPAARTLSILVTLPLVMPSYVVALTLLGAGGPRGVITELLGLESIPALTGFWGSWLALTVFAVPFVHLGAVPALRKLDTSLEEAARGLGSSRWTAFRTITVPLLRPTIAASSLLVALYTISDFGAVSLLRYDTFTRAIYAQFQGRIDRRPALTLAVLLMVVAIGIVVAERRLRRKATYHKSRPGRTHVLQHLGPIGRSVAYVGFGALTAVSLVIPISVLTAWVFRGLGSGQELGDIWADAARSLGVSLAAAVAAAIVAIPIAVVIVRDRTKTAPVVETVTWTSYSLPHITVGIALVTFALEVARPFYQTSFLVVVAYLAMFLPITVGTAADALRRISPDTEDASRSLGKSAIATVFRITVPLMAPGLLAGGALVFLTAMKELPATLLLRPNGFETLAIRIWATTGEGFYTRAGAAALVLLAVSAIPLTLVTLRDLSD